MTGAFSSPAFPVPSWTPRTRSTIIELNTQPPDQVTGLVGFRFLDQKLTIGGEIQHAFEYSYQKPHPTIPRRTVKVEEDYTLVNLFAGYEVTRDFRVDLRLENIFDESLMSGIWSAVTSAGGDPYLEPGFNAKISATWRFGG